MERVLIGRDIFIELGLDPLTELRKLIKVKPGTDDEFTTIITKEGYGDTERMPDCYGRHGK
jgi:hypothetical protein